MFNSLCIGMTVPILPSDVIFERCTWLLKRPVIANPSLLHKILTTFSPEIFLSPGNRSHLKYSNK